MGPYSFTWMNSSWYYNSFSLTYLWNSRIFITFSCDSKIFTMCSLQSLAKHFICNKLTAFGILLNSLQISFQVSISIRLRISEVHFISSVFELICKRCCIERLTTIDNIFSDAILEVCYIVSAFVPARFLFFCGTFWIYGHFHTIIE